MQELPVSCNLDCGGGCALLATVDGGRVVAIRDNPARPPDSVGCARGFHAHEAMYSENRIGRPLLRVGRRGSLDFREADWDEALTVVAEGLTKIQTRYGSKAILGLAGAGACRGEVHNTVNLTKRFLSCVADGYTGTHGGYSANARNFVLPYMFGRTDVGIDAATLEDSQFILLWGANVADTRFGASTETVLRRIHERGTPIVAIDPRRTRTVRTLSDEWIPIIPGSDSALMSAMLYVLVTEGLVDRDFVETRAAGFGTLESSILGKRDRAAATPEWAAPITGMHPSTMRDLARRYAASQPAALLSGLSIQRAVGGEEAVRLSVALQTATGNIGVSGGAPGCCIWDLLPGPRSGIPATAEGRRGPSRTVPVYRWPDAILGAEPLDGEPIRAVYIVGANYLVTGSDINKNRRAFDSLEFSVCHEHTLTPTARQCDVVLPATTYLERADVVFPVGNRVFYSSKAVDPLGEARNDYDIFAALASLMGEETLFTEGRAASEWLGYLLENSGVLDIEALRETGIYDGGAHRRSGLADFVSDPAGKPLPTPSGRIELVSRAYAEAGGLEVPCYAGVTDDISVLEKYSLRMVTPHARNRINSQNALAPWAQRLTPQRLSMHRSDAAARRLEDGDRVLVESKVGDLVAILEITDDILPGVVSLDAGMWPDSGRVLFGEVTAVDGAPNLITSTDATETSAGSTTHTNFVEVSRYA